MKLFSSRSSRTANNGGAKKLSAAAIAIILVVVMTIGGTVAFLMDSAKGMATVGGVTIDGANKTVSGLSNTTWEVAKATQDVSVGGYKGSTKVATESQMAAAISEAQLRLLS